MKSGGADDTNISPSACMSRHDNVHASWPTRPSSPGHKLALLLPAAFSSTTGLLPLLEPRMRTKPATTERAPPPREHTFLLQRRACGETVQKTGKENQTSKR